MVALLTALIVPPLGTTVPTKTVEPAVKVFTMVQRPLVLFKDCIFT